MYNYRKAKTDRRIFYGFWQQNILQNIHIYDIIE